MPVNLLIIACCQAAIWAIVRLLPHTGRIERYQWLKIAVIGTVFGILMDLLLGIAGLFAYLPEGAQAKPVEPKDLPLFLFFINAFLSYGLAVATTALIADSIIERRKSSKFWLFALGILVTLGTLGIFLSSPASLPMMFSCGMTIVAGGEFLLVINNQSGPLVLLFSNVSYLPFLKLWAFSILLGAGYEIANLYFPFWVWLPSSNISEINIRVLVIFLGYVALCHPIAVLWNFFGSKTKNSRLRWE